MSKKRKQEQLQTYINIVRKSFDTNCDFLGLWSINHNYLGIKDVPQDFEKYNGFDRLVVVYCYYLDFIDHSWYNYKTVNAWTSARRQRC